MPEISEPLINKIEWAASENYRKYYEEFAELRPADLFKTAYLHGFNCGYNIYDVAEERVDGMIKGGVTLSKDIPEVSLKVTDGADELLEREGSEILNHSDRDIYINGYHMGFEGAWDRFFDESIGEEINEIVDYYFNL